MTFYIFLRWAGVAGIIALIAVPVIKGKKKKKRKNPNEKKIKIFFKILKGCMIKYFAHLLLNLKPAVKALVLCLFHIIHGLIPIRYTDHEYYNFRFFESD